VRNAHKILVQKNFNRRGCMGGAEGNWRVMLKTRMAGNEMGSTGTG
jgi:hypothetical protein